MGICALAALWGGWYFSKQLRALRWGYLRGRLLEDGPIWAALSALAYLPLHLAAELASPEVAGVIFGGGWVLLITRRIEVDDKASSVRRYTAQGRMWPLLAMGCVGMALTALSEGLSLRGAGETISGAALALGAAVIMGKNAVTYGWCNRLFDDHYGAAVSPSYEGSPKRMLWCIHLLYQFGGMFVGGLMSLGVSIFVPGGGVSLRVATLLLPFSALFVMANSVAKWVKISTDNLGVTGLGYAGVLFTLCWLAPFGEVSAAHPDLLWAGAVILATSNVALGVGARGPRAARSLLPALGAAVALILLLLP